MFPISEIIEEASCVSEDVYEQTIQQVGQYWRNFFSQTGENDFEDGESDDEKAYGPENREPAWFGNIAMWLKPLIRYQMEVDSGKENVKQHLCPFILPISVTARLNMIVVELNTLLPRDNPNVSALLPVLIYSYFLNRKDTTDRKKCTYQRECICSKSDYERINCLADTCSSRDLCKCNKTKNRIRDCKSCTICESCNDAVRIKFDTGGYPVNEEYLDGTGRLYIDIKSTAQERYPAQFKGKDPLLQRAEKLFRLKHWGTEYSTLTLKSLKHDHKKTQLHRILGKILLFTTLTYHLRDICNVTMSLDVFESLTGYLSMVAVDLPMFRSNVPKLIPPNSDPFRLELIPLLKKMQAAALDDCDPLSLYTRFQYLFRLELWYKDHKSERRDLTCEEMELLTNDDPMIWYIIEGERNSYQRNFPKRRGQIKLRPVDTPEE